MYKKVLALDPGNETTGFVLWDSEVNMMIDKGKVNNSVLLDKLSDLVKMNYLNEKVEIVGIEMFSSYFIPVGQSSFDSCVFIGIILNRLDQLDVKSQLIFRQSIKMHHAHAISKVNDTVINGILRQKYGEDNSQKFPNKVYWNEYVEKSKGDKYMNGDIWSAFALATFLTEPRESLIRDPKEREDFKLSKFLHKYIG